MQYFIQEPRRFILLGLLLSFFLPWVSYGFLQRSGFSIPIYIDEISRTIKFIATLQGKHLSIPKEIIYVYGLYLYPIFYLFVYFFKAKVFQVTLALLIIIPFSIGFKFLSWSLFDYFGLGFYLTIFLALALVLELPLRNKHL